MGKTEFPVDGHNVIRYSNKEDKPVAYYVQCYSGNKRMMIKCDNYKQVKNLTGSRVYAASPRSAATPVANSHPPVAKTTQPVAATPVAITETNDQTTYKAAKRAVKKAPAKKATKKTV